MFEDILTSIGFLISREIIIENAQGAKTTTNLFFEENQRTLVFGTLKLIRQQWIHA